MSISPTSFVSNTIEVPKAIFPCAPSHKKFACCDTGSSNVLVRQSDASRIILTPHLDQITVSLPNGNTIRSTSSGHLHFHNLPHSIPAYIFPDDILHTSLLSVSEFCNVGCDATFTATSFYLTYMDMPVLQGTKPPENKLWSVDIPTSAAHDSTSTPVCNASHLSTDTSFVSFVHASLGSPVLSTFLNAIRLGYLATWPRLTTTVVLAHPLNTIATAKGHLNQRRQGLDSTKHTPLQTDTFIPEISVIEPPGNDPPTINPTQFSNYAYTKLISISPTLSADLTGKFAVAADSGAQYVLISEMDGYIHSEPMPSRHHTSYIAAFERTIDFFTKLGRPPTFLRLDNETSRPLDTYMSRKGIAMQYCPPGMHRSNKAERSIQTFTNHAISTFCTTAKDFPLTLWDKLLP